MIFIGYQGVGKSTAAASNVNMIDLESSSFWLDIAGTRHRDTVWYLPYCNIAENLSKQGYDVFVSSHANVRARLARSTEYVVTIYPALSLKDSWTSRLEARYNTTHLDKDYKAWMNAVDRYTENIEELKLGSGHKIEIQSMDYDLISLIHEYKQNNGIYSTPTKRTYSTNGSNFAYVD